MEPTYENIKPLIKNETVENNQVKVAFQAEGQETPVESVGVVAPETSDVVKDAGKKAAKRSIFSSLIRMVSGAAGSAAGGGIAGSAARSATSSAGYAATRSNDSGGIKVKMTPEKQQGAVVEAFKSVQTMYDWDEGSGSWKAKG